jgi:hypothetical protein
VTEPEVIEMVNLYAGNGLSSFSLWVSFTFAYLTVAYLVGAKLSNVQLYIVSAMYCITAGVFALAAVTYALSFTALTSTYREFNPTDFWLIPWTSFSSVILIGGTLASLYFMWDVRHPKTE